MKKLLTTILLMVSGMTLVACQDEIYMSFDEIVEVVELVEGDTYDVTEIDINTNETDGFVFGSSNDQILTISASGLVTAVAAGEADVTIQSRTDSSVMLTVSFDVSPYVELSLDITELDLKEDDVYSLDVQSNGEVSYASSDPSVVTIDEDGVVTAIGVGEATLYVTSALDDQVTRTVTVTVDRLITLSIGTDAITLTEDDTYQVVATSNDDVTYESSNLNIFVVDEDGLITAQNEGTATLTVTSTYDDTVTATMTVNVDKLVTLAVTQDDYVMVVGDMVTLDVTTNDSITYQSSEPNVASVTAGGTITANQFGTATIYITSVSDNTKVIEVSVTVFKYTEALEIEGNDVLIVGMTGQLNISVDPVGAYDEVVWTSSDPTTATVDDAGLVTGIDIGTTTITATSVLDDSIVATFQIEVINVSIIDDDSEAESIYPFMGMEMEYGERLFSSIQQAIDASPAGTKFYLADGTYDEDIIATGFVFEIEGIGDNVVLRGTWDLQANHVIMTNLIFEGDAMIHNSVNLSTPQSYEAAMLHFIGNTVRDLTATNGYFLDLDGLVIVSVSDNTFDNIAAGAIAIVDFPNGDFTIEKNTFTNVSIPITFQAVNEYDLTTSIDVRRNTIDNADTAFAVDLIYDTDQQKTIDVVFRFNSVTNTTTHVIASADNTIDFTLNHWGCVELDMNQFQNVDPYYLRGFYTLAEHIPAEGSFDPDLPLFIIVTNPIESIMIGETHTFEYDILPMELADHPIRFITGDPELVAINQTGEITPLKSGEVYIQVRSAINSAIRTQVDFQIETTPGIELTPSVLMNGFTVGDTLTLTAEPFPAAYASETVDFVSSDPSIATINAAGEINMLAPGVVTFTASLQSDPTVTQTYTLEVFNTLDPLNLLDYLTMNQVMYTQEHRFTVYGFQYNFGERLYESVSHYYFGDIVVNDSKIVPVSYGIRPGEPFDPLPVGYTQYNPQNAYWIVIHDTASTATGSNALAHANWLYNSALAGTELWVSWHFTIDDTYTYQHLPLDERGYHAGDGSTRPGEGTYTGGGNRNGIGIEMAVNDDGDVFRTWQRTAKLVVDLLFQFNLPIENQKYHNDFSGKDCPNTLRNAGLVPLFEEFIATEYHVRDNFPDAEITFESHNPDILDDHGRIIAMPDRAMTVSYTITVTYDGITESRTFYTYVPGTVR